MARKTYYLDKDFGLDESKGARLIGQDMTITEAKSLFGRFHQRMTTKGPAFKGRPLTDAEFLRLSWFDCAWGQAKYLGQGGGQPIETGYLSSNNHIVVPEGTYRHTIIPEFSSGEYEMQGTGYTDVGNDSVNTKLEVWHENWMGHPEIRDSLVSGSWGVTGNMGYVEGTRFHNFRLNGRQDATPEIIATKFRSSGLMAWKPGEITDSGRIWAENYRTRGFEFYQPTPTVIGNFSAFQCVQAGLGFMGNWGGTAVVNMLSSDACGVMFELAHFQGEAGGCVNFNGIKNETMVASSGRSWRMQAVGYLRGQYLVNIGVLSGAVGGGILPALFIVDPRITNGTMQGSALRFGVKGFNYQNLIHNVATGTAHRSPGNYQAGFFEHYADTDELITRAKSKAPDQTGLARFRVVGRTGTGTVSMAPTATPYREIIVGPPAFAQTVYLDDAVTPPTPPVDPPVPPVEPPVPPVEPPPTGSVIATLNNFSNPTNTNRSQAVNWKGVKRFRFTNLTVVSTPNFQRLAYASASDTSGLRVQTNGVWKIGSANCPGTPAAFVPGTYATAEIVLPTPQDFLFFLANRPNGTAWLFSADKIEVLNA